MLVKILPEATTGSFINSRVMGQQNSSGFWILSNVDSIECWDHNGFFKHKRLRSNLFRCPNGSN